MTRWPKLWRIGAALYFFVNVAGGISAAIEGEEMHMMLHIFLVILGLALYGGWRLGRRAPKEPKPAQIPAERLEYLQQSVDAIALEVERVGEAQRFAEKLRAEQDETSPLKKDQ
jgi:hypothetical protein